MKPLRLAQVTRMTYRILTGALLATSLLYAAPVPGPNPSPNPAPSPAPHTHPTNVPKPPNFHNYEHTNSVDAIVEAVIMKLERAAKPVGALLEQGAGWEYPNVDAPVYLTEDVKSVGNGEGHHFVMGPEKCETLMVTQIGDNTRYGNCFLYAFYPEIKAPEQTRYESAIVFRTSGELMGLEINEISELERARRGLLLLKKGLEFNLKWQNGDFADEEDCADVNE